MSTLQEFLIKNAGMDKGARTAIAKRLWASTMTPQEVVKRFGKVKGNRYLDDIDTASKNHINSLSVSGTDNTTRSYLRHVLANDAVRQLHFNNKLSKSDYLKHLSYDSRVSNSSSRYNDILRAAGSQSGLSDIYKTLPVQDRLLVSKYLRGAVPESALQQLPNDVRQSAQNARASLLHPAETLPERSRYAKTLQQEYGIKSREELIKEIQAQGLDFNPDELKHSHYVLGDLYRHIDYLPTVDKQHVLRAATKLPYTSNGRLPAQEAAITDVLSTSAQFNSNYVGANDKLPRSVQKALQIIKGENVLEPGTRANRLFNKVYNNKALYNKLDLTDADDIPYFVNGQNAAYLPNLDTLIVHPKAFGPGTKAHELGHRAAYTMAPEAHAEEAFSTFRKMQLLGKKYNMNVPLGRPRLMQEVFAESYIPKLLGPNSGAAEFFYSPKRNLRQLDAAALAQNIHLTAPKRKIAHRKILERYKANRDAINAMNTSEDTKDLFRQLLFNYSHWFV